jgi:hypothetical protein
MRAELYQIAGDGRQAMTINAFRIRVAPSAAKRSIPNGTRGERRFSSPSSASKQRMVGRSCTIRRGYQKLFEYENIKLRFN